MLILHVNIICVQCNFQPLQRLNVSLESNYIHHIAIIRNSILLCGEDISSSIVGLHSGTSFLHINFCRLAFPSITLNICYRSVWCLNRVIQGSMDFQGSLFWSKMLFMSCNYSLQPRHEFLVCSTLVKLSMLTWESHSSFIPCPNRVNQKFGMILGSLFLGKTKVICCYLVYRYRINILLLVTCKLDQI